MTFLHKHISEKNSGEKKLFNFVCFGLLLLIFVLPHSGGQFVISNFSNPDLSRNTIHTSGIHIADRDTMLVQLLKDGLLPSADGVDSSWGTDVIAFTDDKFIYFWVDYDQPIYRVVTSSLTLTSSGYNFGTFDSITRYNNTKIEQVDGVQSLNGNFAATFLRGGTYGVIGSNRSDDTIQTAQARGPTIIPFVDDTFIVVTRRLNTRIEIEKVALNGNAIEQTGISIEHNHGTILFHNSVAIDSSGNILVLLTEGLYTAQKDLYYVSVNGDLSAILDNGAVETNVSDNGSVQNYPDAPVVSYCDGKFITVYWKKLTGIYIRTFNVNGGIVTTSNAISVAQGNNIYRSPTIATNGKLIVIAWINLSTHTIEGKIIPVVGGIIGSVPAQTTTFSYSTTQIDTTGPELNCAINSMNSIAFSWTLASGATASAWASRGVQYSLASWVSSVDSVAIILGDSIIFDAGIFSASNNGGTSVGYLSVGLSADTSSGWSSWINFTDSVAIASNTIGQRKYFRYRFDLRRNPIDTIAGPNINSAIINWNIKPRILTLDSVHVNSVLCDTMVGFGSVLDIISDIDTVGCFISYYDGDSDDNVFIEIPWDEIPSIAKDTSIGTTNRYTYLRLSPTAVWDTVYTAKVLAIDDNNWNSESQLFSIRVRKPAPVIDTVRIDGVIITDTLAINIVKGVSMSVSVDIERDAIVNWNRVTYRFVTERFDTIVTDNFMLSFIPTDGDTTLSIIAEDAFGATDTFKVDFIYPEFATDSANNYGYFIAKKILADSLWYTIGADSLDTILIPILNTGNDMLVIDSIKFNGSVLSWFNIGVPQLGAMEYYSSTPSQINPLNILSTESETLIVIIDVSNLLGDSLRYDTISVWTNDPINFFATIPVCIEHNDAPTITSFGFTFDADTPYWEVVRGYDFPPHARLQIAFNEPMDSSSFSELVYGYSVFDSNFLLDTIIDTIRMIPHWSDGYTVLNMSPEYTKSSLFFDSLLPPVGLFIPTDSIAIKLLAGVKDQGITPHGSYGIDLNGDFFPDTIGDTIFRARVDSITFTLNTEQITPSHGDSGIESNVTITLCFSAPVYPGTIDTSHENNKSLLVTSRYNSSLDSMRQIIFDSVYIQGCCVYFIPKKQFFIGDSVYCYYRGVYARDSLGYSIDMNNNGIPMGVFDSISLDDDYQWSFLVTNITHVSVSPESASVDVDCKPVITMTFSAALIPGVIDTETIGNKSLIVTSTYSMGDTLGFDSVRVLENKAHFYLKQTLFYADSVFCDFVGFLTADSAGYSIDFGFDDIYNNGDSRSWYFHIKEIVLESVSPESSSVSANAKCPIIMTFSSTITHDMFDTIPDADSNRSFCFMTSYSDGDKVSFNNIRISDDSLSVIVDPSRAFFSNDSIFCEFFGFKCGYNYNAVSGIIPSLGDSNTFAAYSWYFKTELTNFYTFPNPYKPSEMRTHQQFSGIMFKNLHAIKHGLTSVRIKIFNLHTNCIYESSLLYFEESNPDLIPQWLWDTKNRRGNFVASGIYFYAIYDQNNELLLKSKLLIVR